MGYYLFLQCEYEDLLSEQNAATTTWNVDPVDDKPKSHTIPKTT